jgi:hypothetical protein
VTIPTFGWSKEPSVAAREMDRKLRRATRWTDNDDGGYDDKNNESNNKKLRPSYFANYFRFYFGWLTL